MGYRRSIIELENGLCMEQFEPAKATGKTPMLFAHGNFAGSWCFHNLLAYFAERGVASHAVNYRGHWLSGGHAELGKAVTEDYVTDVEACLRSIGREAILVGHSMGGVVGQLTAERNRLEKLVLLDSGPCKEITETYFQPRPGMGHLLRELYEAEPDRTIRMKRNPEGIKAVFFERDKVSDETLARTVAFLGPESSHVVQNHAFISVDPKKFSCPVYVLGREGLGNEEKPDLWHALADYLNAKERHISGEISHNMFMERDWEAHAARIEKWCFG